MSSKKAKIPVARLGSWFHETYGTLTITQQDFDDIIRNFKTNARGYEPFLKAGHNRKGIKKGSGVYDDEKALGFMEGLVQEGEVLFGIFEPTKNSTVVDDVDNGEYRYASPEWIRKAIDRKTGKPAGTFLRGVALTNAPSIPDLPRNSIIEVDSLAQLLSDDFEIERDFIPLNSGVHMPSENQIEAAVEPVVETEAVVEAVETVAEVTEPAAEAEQATETAVEPVVTVVAPVEPVIKESVLEKMLGSLTAAFEKFASAIAPVPTPVPQLLSDDVKAEDKPLETVEEPAACNAHDLVLPCPVCAAEAAKAEADAKLKEAEEKLEALAAEKLEAEEAARAAREAELAAEAERKEAEYEQLLSDRVEALVASGVAPVKADRAKALIVALKGREQEVLLSDDSEPVNLAEAVFELLSDRADVEFGQTGETSTPQDPPSVGQAYLAELRAKREALQPAA